MEASTVSAQVIPIEPAMPGTSPSRFPMPFHQIGKNVRGLYQSDPLIMLITTHASMASQLIDPKSIAAFS